MFTGRAALLRLFQPLEHLAGDVERRIGRHDVAPGRIGVEDHGVVGFGAEPLDHGIHAGLDRLQQLRLALLGAGLQLVRALLEALLQLLQVPLLDLLGQPAPGWKLHFKLGNFF